MSYDGTRVQIETRPEAGRTNIGPKRRFWVEHNLLYPVIKGASDLKACQYKPRSMSYMQSSQIAELHPHGYPKQKRKLSKTIGFYMIISVHLNSSCGVAPHIGQECLPLHIMRYIMWVAIHLRHGK